MLIKYTAHLKNRLNLRKIPDKFPERIYLESQERYFDIITKNKIAVKKLKIKNVEKEMMIAYNEDMERVEIITCPDLSKLV